MCWLCAAAAVCGCVLGLAWGFSGCVLYGVYEVLEEEAKPAATLSIAIRVSSCVNTQQ